MAGLSISLAIAAGAILLLVAITWDTVLSFVTNNPTSLRAPTFHFMRRTRTESPQNPSLRPFRVRTSSGPTGIARLQCLASDKRIWDGGRHRAKLYVEEFFVTSLYSREDIIYTFPPSHMARSGHCRAAISRLVLGTISWHRSDALKWVTPSGGSTQPSERYGGR